MNTDYEDPPEEIRIPVHVDMAGYDPVWVTVTTEDAYALSLGETAKVHVLETPEDRKTMGEEVRDEDSQED